MDQKQVLPQDLEKSISRMINRGKDLNKIKVKSAHLIRQLENDNFFNEVILMHF